MYNLIMYLFKDVFYVINIWISSISQLEDKLRLSLQSTNAEGYAKPSYQSETVHIKHVNKLQLI